MAGFRIVILTPRGEFFNGEVESVKFSNSIGRIEVLPGHINYMSEIIPSILEIKQSGVKKNAVVTEGIFEFSGNIAAITVEAAEWPGQIDLDRALSAKERARARMKSRDDSIDSKRAELALLRAEVRIKCGRNTEANVE